MNNQNKKVHSVSPITTLPGERNKIILLGVLTFAVSALFWWMAERSFAIRVLQFRGTDGVQLAATFVVFFLMFSFVAMIGMLVHDRLLSKALLLLTALAYLLIFGVTVLGTIAVLLVILAFWLYDRHLKMEQRDRIRFSVGKILRNGIGVTLTLCLLAISITFYDVTNRQAGAASSPVDAFIRGAANTTNKILSLQVPGYDPTQSLDAFLLQAALKQAKQEVAALHLSERVPPSTANDTSQLLEQFLGKDQSQLLENLPPEIRAQIENDPAALQRVIEEQAGPVLEQGLGEARKQLLDSLGVQAEGTTPMGEVVYRFLEKQIKMYAGPYEQFLPTLLALSLYFTLQILAFVYIFMIAIFSAAVFWLLQHTGVAAIREAETTVQYPALSKEGA